MELTLAYYEPKEIINLTAKDLANLEVLRKIRDSFIQPFYRSEVGDASKALEYMRDKLASVPKNILPPESAELLDQCETALQFWNLASLSPEDVQIFLQANVKFLLSTEAFELSREMPNVAMLQGSPPDLFLRWLGSAAQGLRAAEQEIGNSRITIYSGKVTRPTIGAWVQDYERFAENHPADGNVMIAEYITKSPNVRGLNEVDVAALRKVFSWFNIVQFDQGPALSVSPQEKIDRPRTMNPVPTSQPKRQDDEPVLTSVQPKKVIHKTSNRPKSRVPSPSQSTSREEQLLTSLHNTRNLVDRFERAERDLPPAGKNTVAQLSVLAQNSLQGEEKSGRVISGIFQVVRARGLQALLTDSSFVNLMRKTMVPVLEKQLRLTREQAIHVTDLPVNRIVVLKEFFKLLFNSATGSENDAARLMVHISSIVPETLAGPESGFAYFDLNDQHFHWSLTEVRASDGVLRNRIP